MKTNNYFKLLILHLLLLSAAGCKKNGTVSDNPVAISSKTDSNTSAETLLFKSYFSNTSFSYTSPATDDYDGTNSTGYSWSSGLGAKFRMYYDEGSYSDRRSTIVSETDGDKVVKYEIVNASVVSTNPQKARIQTDLYAITDPTLTNTTLKDIYQKVNVKLDYTSFNKLLQNSNAFVKGDWLTLMEIWNNKSWGTDAAAKYPFRIGLGLKKIVGTPNKFNFYVNAEQGNYNATTKLFTSWGADPWTATNSLSVPLGEWITLEFFLREGANSTDKGEFWLAVTPLNTGVRTVIVNKTGANSDWTRHPDNPSPDGLTHWNPMKLYTSKNIIDVCKSGSNPTSLKVYWDDFYLYKGKRP